MNPITYLFTQSKAPASRELSQRVDDFLTTLVQEGSNQICLADNEPLPLRFHRCSSPLQAAESDILQYRDVLLRLEEMADIDRRSADRESRGKCILKIADCSYVIEIICGPGGSWLTINISPLRSPESPRVPVPRGIWTHIRAWEGEHLCPFDVRLRDGTVHKNILIDSQGVIEGQLFRQGKQNGYVSVQFDSSDILAIRPRTGSLVAELGLARWIRE